MSSMVDHRSEHAEMDRPRCEGTGALGSLVEARFIVLAVVVGAAVGLGFSEPGGGASRNGAAAGIPALRLDPNTVPPEVLTALPRMGPALVDRWVEAREERPFRSLEDVRGRVRGLGPATFDQIAPYFADPDGRGRTVKTTVSQKAGRAPAKRQTAKRKKPGSNKASATQQARLAASQ